LLFKIYAYVFNLGHILFKEINLNFKVVIIIKRHNLFIISLNKYILPLIFCIFTCCLLIFSRQNLNAAKSGILLWADSVLPALLPFFIATELLSYTNIIPLIGKLLNKIMRPLFNVPGEGAFAFIMGIISGYPVGAKIVTKFRNDNICTKEEGERLLAFTNNSGPLFIVGTVGISLFGDTKIGILLLFTHILACITVGIIFRFWKNNKKVFSRSELTSSEFIPKEVTFSNLGEILKLAIMNSINTVVMIGGFVVLFSVIVSILKNTGTLHIISITLTPIFSFLNIPLNFSSGIITGIVELTNGLKDICQIHVKELNTSITLCSFLLGFGGISVLLQVFSIISKSDVSIKPYFIGKLLHGTFSALYTFILLNFVPFLSMNL